MRFRTGQHACPGPARRKPGPETIAGARSSAIPVVSGHGRLPGARRCGDSRTTTTSKTGETSSSLSAAADDLLRSAPVPMQARDEVSAIADEAVVSAVPRRPPGVKGARRSATSGAGAFTFVCRPRHNRAAIGRHSGRGGRSCRKRRTSSYGRRGPMLPLIRRAECSSCRAVLQGVRVWPRRSVGYALAEAPGGDGRAEAERAPEAGLAISTLGAGRLRSRARGRPGPTVSATIAGGGASAWLPSFRRIGLTAPLPFRNTKLLFVPHSARRQGASYEALSSSAQGGSRCASVHRGRSASPCNRARRPTTSRLERSAERLMSRHPPATVHPLADVTHARRADMLAGCYYPAQAFGLANAPRSSAWMSAGSASTRASPAVRTSGCVGASLRSGPAFRACGACSFDDGRALATAEAAVHCAGETRQS